MPDRLSDVSREQANALLSLSRDLLAVVSAPSLNTATIRHIEVLALQPQVVMVVIITSTGGVSKMLSTFERPVDPGLLTWAGEYLRERLVGMGLGARMLHSRLADPGLGVRERAFVEAISRPRPRMSCIWRAPRSCSRPARSRTPRSSTAS